MYYCFTAINQDTLQNLQKEMIFKLLVYYVGGMIKNEKV